MFIRASTGGNFVHYIGFVSSRPRRPLTTVQMAERLEPVHAERRGEGHVGGVAPPSGCVHCGIVVPVPKDASFHLAILNQRDHRCGCGGIADISNTR